jgi:hypothetical protein
MSLTNRPLRLLALALPLVFACAHEPATTPAKNEPVPCPYADANDGTQSYDILCREPVANHVSVKHILIGWKELSTPDHPRPTERSYEEAQQLARDLLQKLRGGEAIEPLMSQYSEDPGSASGGTAYDVTPGAGLILQFKSLSLRLNVGEAGIVKSAFGLHVIQRVQ